MGQESVTNQPSHAINQIIGLVVFAGGIVLLIIVFAWAYRLYQSVDAGLFQVQPAQVQPSVPGLGEGKALPPGTLIARPQPAASVAPVGLVLLVKMLVLVVMGWVGALITGKGIALATGPPRHVERPA